MRSSKIAVDVIVSFKIVYKIFNQVGDGWYGDFPLSRYLLCIFRNAFLNCKASPLDTFVGYLCLFLDLTVGQVKLFANAIFLVTV